MCGRYQVFSEEEVIEIRQIIMEINERMKNQPEKLAAMKTGEIVPSFDAPVLGLSREENRIVAGLMTWGIPRWDNTGININSRVDTITSAIDKKRPTAFDTRRCIIPSTGYYEWTHVGKKAVDKYLHRLPGQNMLYMAGTWANCKDKHGNDYLGFVILTTDATSTAKIIHNRMPVIVQPNEIDAWITDRAAAFEIMHRPGPELVLQLAG
jgi:putative SOS response-associated peptidase YedK